MADPRFFLNADGSMKTDVCTDNDDTSDEESPVTCYFNPIRASGTGDSVANVCSGEDPGDIDCGEKNCSANFKTSGSTGDHYSSAALIKLKASVDPILTSVSTASSAKKVTRQVPAEKAKMIQVQKLVKDLSPRLSLSVTKRSGSPGLSLLKRRKLPLKRKLPIGNIVDDVPVESRGAVESTNLKNSLQCNGEDLIIQNVPIVEAAKKMSPQQNKAKKFKPSMARPIVATPSIVSEKRILLHAGPADSLPAGWTVKHYKRTTGLKHTDRYWFSPLLKKKFRSLAQVGRFLDFLQKGKGDETKAWNLFRLSPPGPDEIRSRYRANGEKGDKRKKLQYGNHAGMTIRSSTSINDNATGISIGSRSFEKLNGAVPRSWRLPLISSPGLMMLPPPSILHRHNEQYVNTNSKQEIQIDDKNGKYAINPSSSIEHTHDLDIELDDRGYISPSLVFDHALYEAGYAKDKLAEATYFGSSIIRTVDDVFHSRLSVENIQLVPENVWNQNVDDRQKTKLELQVSNHNGVDYDRFQMGRLAKDVLIESLKQLVREGTRSNHDCLQFEDMIPKSLTSPTPQPFTNSMNNYLRSVRDRERALKVYHAGKKLNEDATDAYEEAMDDWRQKKEVYELKKHRREAERWKLNELNPDDNSHMEDTNKNGITGLDETQLSGKTLISEVGRDSIGENKFLDGEIIKCVNETVPKGLGPEPQPPIPSNLNYIPAVPIPPTAASYHDSTKRRLISQERQYLVAHLDPASFSEGERYYQLSSNCIADPQFVGPNAPGISGLNNNSGAGVSTSYFGKLNSASGCEKSHSNLERQKRNHSMKDRKTSSNTSSKSKIKKELIGAGIGPTPTSTAVQLKRIMEKGDSVADALRQSIIKAAIYASRTGVHSGSFVALGETYPEISKAFSNHAKCRPCARCKNNKQGAYHCRLKRRHTDKDHDGGSSYTILTPLFQAKLENLVCTRRSSHADSLKK